jgi:hypothetical protein
MERKKRMCALCMFVFQNLLHSLMTFVCIQMQYKKTKRENDMIVTKVRIIHEKIYPNLATKYMKAKRCKHHIVLFGHLLEPNIKF